MESYFGGIKSDDALNFQYSEVQQMMKRALNSTVWGIG